MYSRILLVMRPTVHSTLRLLVSRTVSECRETFFTPHLSFYILVCVWDGFVDENYICKLLSVYSGFKCFTCKLYSFLYLTLYESNLYKMLNHFTMVHCACATS